MSEEQPSLQIDIDWKKQAQEEKRKLAERAQATAPPAAPGLLTPGSGTAAAGAASAPATPRGGPPDPRGAPADPRAARGRRETPPASFGTLVNSLLTQTLLYLGDIATSAGPMVDLDRAKHQVDTLTMLEEKTKNNLSEEEQHLLDSTLYEVRMRFVNVASQYL